MTITKFLSFVILSAACGAVLPACSVTRSRDVRKDVSSHYFPPKQVGTIADPKIDESSGLIASKCQPNVFWTHNDSGDAAVIYAFDKSGAKLGTWSVQGARNIDWEDIAGYKDASGKCLIYIGEIGDNDGDIPEHTIYRVPEPLVGSPVQDPGQRPETDRAEALTFSYPDGKPDAETLLVDPASARIYVMTKRKSGPAKVYRIENSFGLDRALIAEKVADVSMPAVPTGFVTGGDVSPDGRRVIISDYSAGYEFTLPDGDPNFEDIWKQRPEVVDLGKRRGGESVCYSPDGRSIYASSEGKRAPIYEINAGHE